MNPSEPVPVSNSFESVLRTARKGKLLAELSAEMQRAVLAVREHCAGASLTLTIKIEPLNGEGSAVSVVDDIKTKLPQPKKPNTLFFTEEDGRLVREDPNQQDLEFAPKALPSVTAAEPITQTKTA